MSAIGPIDSTRQLRHSNQLWWLLYLGVVGGGLLIAAFVRNRLTEPYLGVSLALILLLSTGWIVRPRVTLAAVVFLTVVSDQVTISWFPFVKNLSSRESISFLADSVTISPLEIALLLGLFVSTLRRYANTRTLLPRTPLTAPLLIFTAFVAMGFVRGISAGGDIRIAVLEGRALFYIVVVFVIVVNECVDEVDVRPVLWAALAGVVVQALLSLEYFGNLEAAERETLESLNEHGSAIAQNLLVVTLLILVLFGVRHAVLKWTLLAGAVPVVFVYLIAQRRAGIAALAVAAIMLAIALFWRRRRTFWIVTPVVAVLVVGYLGAFWNSQGSLGFPAQAIKSIIAPESTSAADQSSDLYRLVEAYDLNFTIRAEALRGIGFGRPFYRPIPLPDISVFELNEFQPHNSVLWIWIKTGFGGFLAMFYLFGRSLMLGAERVRRNPIDIGFVVTLAATLFIAMYAVYTYVDVSWDARNTVLLGLSFAICVLPAVTIDEPTPELRAARTPIRSAVGADAP